MIATIINSLLELGLTLVNLFVKDSARKQQMQETMLALVERQALNISKNVLIRREYEELKKMAKDKIDPTPS